MIPEFDVTTGQLPPGRYSASLEEVEQRFVGHASFTASSTRRDLWLGLEKYLAAWLVVEGQLGVVVLLSVWLGGSYVSTKLDPDDIDIAVVVDRDVLSGLDGQSGVGQLKRLMKDRKECLAKFRVEPHQIRWVRLATPWGADAHSSAGQDYFNDRGTLDDWMQRVRPPGAKVEPRPEDAWPARGYLEVTF